MMMYKDCYAGCGGEDCVCCEIHADHQAELMDYWQFSSDDYDPDWVFGRPDDDDEDW